MLSRERMWKRRPPVPQLPIQIWGITPLKGKIRQIRWGDLRALPLGHLAGIITTLISPFFSNSAPTETLSGGNWGWKGNTGNQKGCHSPHPSNTSIKRPQTRMGVTPHSQGKQKHQSLLSGALEPLS